MAAMNDWIVAGINNPDFTVEDFELAGLDVKNTSILSKDEYKKSPFIQKTFDKDGKFDEKAFDEYYEKRLGEFAYFSLEDKYQYDLFDTDRKPTSRIRNPQFVMYQIANPDRITYGTGERNEFGERRKSRMELAETQKIYDPETDTYSEKTVNDNALVNGIKDWIKSIIDEPLVLAQYDKDGEHQDPYTGQIVKHKKGDYKLNQNGTYYTEKLNGRDPSGKQVLSLFDTLTVDGEGINKYDFFDSDDIDKSVRGVISKSAAQILPLLIPYVDVAYSSALIGKEIAKALPMLYGIFNSYFGDGQDSKVINQIAAYGNKFSTSTSEYSQEHILSFENMANMIVDVVTQWGTQKYIAQGVAKLLPKAKAVEQAHQKAYTLYKTLEIGLMSKVASGEIGESTVRQMLGDPLKWYESSVGKAALKMFVPKAEKAAARANKIAGDASLAYMSMISNTDVYHDMLEHGATKKEAAAFALASMIGMFGVDRWTGLGEIFLKGLGDDIDRSIRATVKKSTAEIADKVIKDGASLPKETNKIRHFFKEGLSFGKNTTILYLDDLKHHSLGFLGKALGEGLEEVGEELVTDLVKSSYEVLGNLGITSQKKIGAWENAGTRYGMSFLGGFLGGGIFGGIDLVLNGNLIRDTSQDEFIYLVQNGYKDRTLKELKKRHDSGKLASTELGMNFETDANGNRIYLSKKPGEMSQNDFVYKVISDSITLLDNIINENQLNLDDELLFMLMVLSDRRFTLLKDYLDTTSMTYLVGYADKFKQLTKDIINTESSLLRASKTMDGVDPGTLTPENTITDEQFRKLSKEDAEKRERNLDHYRNRKQELLKERDKFLSGEYSMPYAEKMLFAIDSDLNKSFMVMNYDLWLYENKKKTIDLLTDSEAELYKSEYLNYKHSAQKRDLDIQFKTFKEIQKLIEPALLDLLLNEKLFDSTKLRELLTEKSPLNIKLYGYNDVLDFAGETEESQSYLERNFEENIEQRKNLINTYNLEALNKAKEKVIELIDSQGGYIDPVLRRQLLLVLQNRNKDIISNWLNINLEYADVLKNLDLENFSNEEDIRKNLEQSILNKYLNVASARLFVYGTLVDELIFDSDVDLTPIIESSLNTLKTAFKNKTGIELSDELAKNLLFTLNVLSEENPGIVTGGQFTEDSIKQDESGNWYITENPLLNGFAHDEYFEDAADYNEFETLLNRFRLDYDNGQEVILEQISNPKEYLKSLPEIQEEIDTAVLQLEELKDISQNHPLIQLNNELQKRVKNINPVKDLIKGLAIKLGKNSNQLESVLNKLADLFESVDRIQEFNISDDELLVLDEAVDLIEKVKSYLYAATIKSGDVLGNGSIIEIGHNKALNDFAKDHNDAYPNFNPLPTISTNTYTILTNELNNYLSEIGIFIPETLSYNAGSWRALHYKNIADKSEQFIKTEKAFNHALLEFFKTSRESMKIKVDGKEYDLLEGYESTGEDLEKILHLIYSNYQNLLNEGITLLKILDLNDLLQRILKVDEVPKQLTGKLNQDLVNLTDYTKLILFGTFLSNDIETWNKFIKSRIDSNLDIAPIFILELVSRIACALTDNPDIFETLFIKIKQLNPKWDLPIINCVFINGVGGAGKSRVCARTVVDWLKKDATVWLSAPKKTLCATLAVSVGKGIEMTLDGENSLFSRIFDVSKIKDMEKDADALKTDSEYFSISNVDGNTCFKVNFDKLGIKKLADAPTILVIDESTYIHNTTLLAILRFCELNHTKLVLLGHDKLSGVKFNQRRELCLMTRTPELSVSLRDNNVQHQYNLRILENLISELSDLSTEDSKRELPRIKSAIKNLRLKVYNETELNGDLVTNNLDDVKFDNILPNEKGERVIGYVGNNQATITLLQNKGLKVELLSELEIQGLEFDLVIVEKNWNLPETAKVADVFLFLTNLYTMISRGRFGTVLLSNSLNDIIGNNIIEHVKAQAPSIKNAIKSFVDKRKNELENVETSQPLKSTSSVSEPNLSSIISDISKTSRLVIDSRVKDGLYSFNWIDKYKGNSIGMRITSNGDDIKIEIGYIKENNLYTLPDDFDLWDVLEIDGDKPDYLTYNTKNRKLSYTVDENITELDENPYPDMLSINVASAPRSTGKTVMYEEPITNPVFSEEINPLDLGDAEEDIIEYEGNVLCYGSTAITGYKVKEKDGKEVWIRPSTEGVLRDLLVFTDIKEISSTETQIKLSNLLRSFRNNFLYNREYENIRKFFKDNILTKQAYDNAKFFVEVRELNDSDNFIRNLGLDRKKLSIGKYVYTVVVLFENKNGEICRVTLGALSDPQSLLKAIPKVIKKLDKKIEKWKELNRNLEDIDKLLERRNSISNKTLEYVKLMEKLESQGPKDIPINRPMFTGMTDIRKVTAAGNEVKPMRLYSYKKALIKSIKELIANSSRDSYKDAALRKIELLEQDIDKSFLALNPYAVVSDVYVYAPDKLGELKGIDKTVVGKAVVFVSNDDSLTPEELPDIYVSLKNTVAVGGESQARVRMLVLNNLGVLFEELISPWHKALMQISDSYTDEEKGKVIKSITPFKNDFMGARMYVSLWNFRANLLEFCDKLTTFVGNNSLNIDLLEKYSIVKDLIYKRDVLKETLTPEENQITYSENDSEFQLYSQKIEEFNLNLNGFLKQFRLGGGYKNGFYIRLIVEDKSLSDLYGDIIPDGIYITPSKAFRFKNIIESIFTNMLDPVIKCEGIDKNKLLTTLEGAINSLSGHYSKVIANGKLILLEKNVTINFEPSLDGSISSAFEDIPAILMKTVKYVNFSLVFEGEDVLYPIIKITHDDNDTVLHYENIYNDLFADEVGANDLNHLISLCLHGTIDDLNNPKVRRCSDAMFPKGLFVDPMCSTEKVMSNKGIAFKKCIINPIFFEVDCMIDDPTFYISFEENNQGSQGLSNESEIWDNPYSEICNILGLDVQENTPIEDIEEFIDEQLSNNLLNVLYDLNIIKLNKPVSREGTKIITFGEYFKLIFKQENNLDLGNIQSIDFGNRDNIVIVSDKYTINITGKDMDNNFEYEKIGINPDSLSSDINNLLNELSTKKVSTNKKVNDLFKNRIKLIETLVESGNISEATNMIDLLISTTNNVEINNTLAELRKMFDC